MAGIRIEGNTSGNVGEVDASNNQLVNTPGYTSAGVSRGGGSENAGAVAMFSENDPGTITGARYVASPETDDDAQLRVVQQVMLDNETFNYAAQNTGKHAYLNTTMTITWAAATGLTINGGAITTINTGALLLTRAMFPILGTTHTYIEFEGSFSVVTWPTNNTLDFGAFLAGATTPYAPTDGVYFRMTNAGLQGVINFNGTETNSSVFTGFVPVVSKKYQFIISLTEREVEFWIDDVLYATVETPSGNGQPCMSAALPVAIRNAIPGTAASGAAQFVVNDYTVSKEGTLVVDSLAQVGNRMYGSYQGLSGGTMGTLANYANSANPTSAAGSNTAANVTGLGGQGAINAAAAAATDFIMCSYQVPAGTVSVQGRRLRINAVKVDMLNMGAAVATTLTSVAISLAFGHTAVSLATAEGANAKAPRRIPLGMAWWAIGAAIGQGPGDGGALHMRFDNPVYVNPGEFIATTMKFLAGTATASQSIWYHVTFDYGWE